MVHLTVGLGEVGSAIKNIVGGVYVTRSAGDWDGREVDVVHICTPYTEEKAADFEAMIEHYKKKSKLVIVHSSVPVGTCDALDVVHSPIRGIHPELEKGIRTFVKYFGGKRAAEAAKIFSDLGLKTQVFSDAKTTEALKLWDTTQYGYLIMLEKTIYKWCREHGVNYEDVYIKANKDYNEGYVELGRPDVVRPWLKHMPGPIGGHCIIPNSKLLGSEFEIPEDIDG